MSDPKLTRRHVLATAGGAALAAHPAANAVAQSVTDAARVVVGPALEPEVITVTDTSMAAWWRTEQPSDTTVVLTALDGPDAGTRTEHRLEEGQTVHAARVDGLRPGTTYRYELRSNGQLVSLGLNEEADPGTFRTLVPPQGKRLATIALINDIHVGETVSGQITGTPLGSIPPSYTGDDYAFRMLTGAVDELAGLGTIDLVVANGDLTDRGRDTEVSRALAELKRLPFPLLVTRGNHDRRLAGACAPDGDCLRAQQFAATNADGDAVLRSVARVGDRVAVVGLDSCEPNTGAARLDLGEQPRWLDEQLTALEAEGREIIVAFHHPILSETEPPQISDTVDAGAAEVLAVLANHPRVRLVVHGHSHRNNLWFEPGIGQRLPFLENGANKEYPAGFALLHVHEDGIMRTFHRPVTPFSKAWVKTSAQQVLGFHPWVTRGSLSSRAWVSSFSPGVPVVGAQARRPRALVVAAATRLARRTVLARGVKVRVTGAGRSAPVRVSLVAQGGNAGRRTTVVLATGRRTGGGDLRLRVAPGARARLRARRTPWTAVLTVSAGGRTARRRVVLDPR